MSEPFGAFLVEGDSLGEWSKSVQNVVADISMRRCPRCKLPITIEEHTQNLIHVAAEAQAACDFLKSLTKGARV